jgi:hypothetical protein
VSTEAEIVSTILTEAIKLGPSIYMAIESAIRHKAPHLLTAPPVRQDAAIRSEDDEAIMRKFGHGGQ